jgi:hypothetical protein
MIAGCLTREVAVCSEERAAYLFSSHQILGHNMGRRAVMPNSQQLRNSGRAYSRRHFWRALLQELRVIHGSARGGQGGQLSQLHELSDERLAKVRPTLNPEYEICVDQDYVCCRHRQMEVTHRLFQMERENLITLNQFNGQHNLGEIAAQLARQMDWDQNKAFTFTRNLFLSLVDLLICIPRDPPELPDH